MTVRIKFSEELSENPTRIKIVGVGGGGGNALNRMIQAKIIGVEFISVNTDAQALRRSLAPVRIQLGSKLTKGLGAGGKPEVGREAAQESRDIIKGELAGADMIFITAGMGGGTGTGASPVVAEIAKSLNALTVAVVTYPFSLEGKVRQQQADEGIKNLRSFVDTLLLIPNDRLFEIGAKDMSWEEGFKLADDVLRQAIQSITDVITVTGVINVDFNDVKVIMSGAGEALMGIGEAEGTGRISKAIESAVHSPLLKDMNIEGAKGVLINITSGKDFKMHELQEAMNIINDYVSPDAHIYYGQVLDESMVDRVRITIIATGFVSKRPGIGQYTGSVKEKFITRNITEDNYEIPAYLRRPVKKLL